jgi:hypothetical protein
VLELRSVLADVLGEDRLHLFAFAEELHINGFPLRGRDSLIDFQALVDVLRRLRVGEQFQRLLNRLATFRRLDGLEGSMAPASSALVRVYVAPINSKLPYSGI